MYQIARSSRLYLQEAWTPTVEKRRIVCSICHGYVGHMFRYGARWVHWTCQLEPMTPDQRKTLLRKLHIITLKNAPGLVLLELNVLDFVIELLRERGDEEGVQWPPRL